MKFWHAFLWTWLIISIYQWQRWVPKPRQNYHSCLVNKGKTNAIGNSSWCGRGKEGPILGPWIFHGPQALPCESQDRNSRQRRQNSIVVWTKRSVWAVMLDNGIYVFLACGFLQCFLLCMHRIQPAMPAFLFLWIPVVGHCQDLGWGQPGATFAPIKVCFIKGLLLSCLFTAA